MYMYMIVQRLTSYSSSNTSNEYQRDNKIYALGWSPHHFYMGRSASPSIYMYMASVQYFLEVFSIKFEFMNQSGVVNAKSYIYYIILKYKLKAVHALIG